MTPNTWIALGGLVATLITLVRGIVQYSRAQQLERAKFATDEIKQLEALPQARNIRLMLEGAARPLDLFPEAPERAGRYVMVTDALLASALALRPPEPAGFSDAEVAIRETFDLFFTALERFERFMQLGLVGPKEFLPYLGYWLHLVGDELARSRPPQVRQAIVAYVDHYNYTGVQALFARFGYDIRPAATGTRGAA